MDPPVERADGDTDRDSGMKVILLCTKLQNWPTFEVQEKFLSVETQRQQEKVVRII
jgi:hypothetical protein